MTKKDCDINIILVKSTVFRILSQDEDEDGRLKTGSNYQHSLIKLKMN